jgi:hypothetical protein
VSVLMNTGIDPWTAVDPSHRVQALQVRGWPNPFRSAVEVVFALPFRTSASLRVYDIQGRLVTTLSDGERAAGTHRVRWSPAADVGASGVYLVELKSGARRATGHLVLMR